MSTAIALSAVAIAAAGQHSSEASLTPVGAQIILGALALALVVGMISVPLRNKGGMVPTCKSEAFFYGFICTLLALILGAGLLGLITRSMGY